MYLEPTCRGAATCAATNSPAPYYKCTNSFMSSSCASDAVIVSYSSMESGHAGTIQDPVVLSGCQKVACGCSAPSYWNGSTCIRCSSGPSGLQLMGSPVGGAPIHTNTACRYCSPNAYLTSTAVAPGVSVDNCIACPGGGKNDGTGGITTCCIPAGNKGSDSTGSFEIVGDKCCYSNS